MSTIIIFQTGAAAAFGLEIEYREILNSCLYLPFYVKLVVDVFWMSLKEWCIRLGS